MLEPTLPRPQLVNRLPFGKIVHDQDESMVVVAIQDFDVDSSVGHQPGERTELTWDSLLQTQDEHISFLNDANTLRFESAACRRAVLEQKMGDAGDSRHPQTRRSEQSTSASTLGASGRSAADRIETTVVCA